MKNLMVLAEFFFRILRWFIFDRKWKKILVSAWRRTAFKRFTAKRKKTTIVVTAFLLILRYDLQWNKVLVSNSRLLAFERFTAARQKATIIVAAFFLIFHKRLTARRMKIIIALAAFLSISRNFFINLRTVLITVCTALEILL